jgi:nucleotide-binding universal stress UspA family protein
VSSRPGNLSLVRSVLHPTDLSPDSELAFQHALAIALLRKTSLTLLHVGKMRDGEDFPSIMEMLQRWELVEAGAPRRAVYEDFNVRIKKDVVRGKPLPAILDYVEKSHADLIVLATRGASGAPRWLKASVSEPLARRTECSTLFVPADGRPMVDPGTGRLIVRKILVPIAEAPDGQNAVILAARTAIAAHSVHGDEVQLQLMHVGEEMPKLELPEHEGIRWSQSLTSGDVIERILESTRDLAADLVVMASDGRNGILDAFRGSHSEQIVRDAPCALLVVPVTAHELPILLT